jgi:competence protein ComEA
MEVFHMKRYMATLAAAALAIGLVSAVYAGDSTSTAPQSAPSTMPEQSGTAAPKATTSHHHHAASMKKASAKMPKVDLNSASKEDLTKVPGVDDALADKIIAARPIASSSELVKKGVVTKAQWSKIKRHVSIKKA